MCSTLTAPPGRPTTITPEPLYGLSVLLYGFMNLDRFFLMTCFLAEAPGAPSHSMD